MPSFSSLPGFRDFYPPELFIRSHIIDAWRKTAQRYGFEEYDGPPLEALELYTEKSGEEIVRQLYNFEDKGGRSVALRPEMTPTFARMVGARAGGMRKPIRWFSIPQLFRYERTQRGRLREHFQWNVDIVGESDVSADVEILAVALDSLRMLGLTEKDIVARVSDRRLLDRLLVDRGVQPEKLGAAYNVIDKIGRDTEETTRKRFREDVGLEEGGVDAALEIFSSTNLSMRSSVAGPEVERMEAYFAQLANLGLADYLRFDPRIVRGLAYYTGIVFEIFDREGELRAICGGGRYDNLLKTVSDVDLPALGFGMGDVVLAELLKDRGLLPEYRTQIDYYIVAVGPAAEQLRGELATRLRGKGHSVIYSLSGGTVSKQFKDAGVRNAAHVIVLGPDEIAVGQAVVKDMSSGQEQKVDLDTL
jgi:histidyl-tRNA synthetase